MNPILLVFLLNLVLNFAAESQLIHHAVLDAEGKYHLSWGPSENRVDDITFKVEVATVGYVGFGLSPNGGMAGGDIVTGWVKDGKVHFQDRHAEGKIRPDVDESTDWHLISGSENGTHTTLIFHRKLDTCDQEDLPIDGSTMRVIYAYSDEDPASVAELYYHGPTNRGAKSVMLLEPERKPPSDPTPDLQHWDIGSLNDALFSGHKSIYWCNIYKAPDLQEKHHIVEIQPVIQAGNEGYVHHLLLYKCVGANPEDYEPLLSEPGHECYHPNMPNVMRGCEGVFAVWGVGGENLVLPEHVGLPLDPGLPTYFMLEIHYDNPEGHTGKTDSSGFRISYTKHLREHDAGALMLGATVTPRLVIPPGQEEYVVAGHSNPDCLGPAMPEGGLNMLGVFLHAHLLGRRLKARHFRGKRELQPLAEDLNYDFNYQDYRYFPKERTLLPEDQITIECTYDSSGRNVTTFGGINTIDEMCVAFILYYPYIERFASVSIISKSLLHQTLGVSFNNSQEGFLGFYERMENFDWETVDVKKVENAFRFSEHDTHCYLGNGSKSSVESKISYPAVFTPYKRAPSCVKTRELTSGCRTHHETLAILSMMIILLCILK